MKPLVTIITVTRNIVEDGRLSFLKQNFESVRSQTYSNIEHLVIDGASTDGTLDILKEYEEKGWIRLISEKDSGIFDAMNKGHKNANGKYALVLNSDDYYASNDVIENLVNLAENEDLDYVYGNQVTISRDSKKILQVWKPTTYAFWQLMPFNHPTMMIKNEVVHKMGFYRTDFSTVADYLFVLKLILDDYKGQWLDKDIVMFRNGGASFAEDSLFEFDRWQYTRLVRVYHWFYSKFDDRLTEEEIIRNYMYSLGGSYDELFFIRLKRYMINLNLKNFNYEEFIKHIDYLRKRNDKDSLCLEKIIKICGIPLFKIYRRENFIKVKFLGLEIYKEKEIK